MWGDFTRDTRRRAAIDNVRAVLLQQGRQLLDADWNEQAGLSADRLEQITQAVVGLQGAPRDAAGFAITKADGGFSIGAGRIYVEGLLVENDEPVTYSEQLGRSDLLPELTTIIPDGNEALVYLEVLLRPASPTGDTSLAEPALAGADTVVRETVAWTVRVQPLSDIPMERAKLIESLEHNQRVTIPAWATTSGGLEADVQTEAEITDPGPCELPPTAGYLDQLNRLYRVVVHEPGKPGTATFKWTEDASREGTLRREGAGFVIDLPIAQGHRMVPNKCLCRVNRPLSRARRPLRSSRADHQRPWCRPYPRRRPGLGAERASSDPSVGDARPSSLPRQVRGSRSPRASRSASPTASMPAARSGRSLVAR